MTTFDTPTHDVTADEESSAFAEEVFGTTLGAVELALVSMGRELGLYEALRGQGTLMPDEVARRAGVDTRYAREWLEHQAVAGVLAVDAEGDPGQRRYSLPESRARCLLDEEHPAYVGALGDLIPMIARTYEAVLDAYRTGAGVPFADYGIHDLQAGMTRPMFANALTTEWIPALTDVQARLDAGDALRVADFGCGEGWAGVYLADAHPNVTVDGFDLDDSSIARAREHAAGRGVQDRVTFEIRDVTSVDFDGRYDLVMCCEVIHDLADPVGALAAMRAAAGTDGAVLVIDEKAAETFEPSRDPVERLLYSFSVLHCLPVGRIEDPSAETGTVMRPDVFRRYATQAGFGSVEVLPIEHDIFRFYRPRR